MDAGSTLPGLEPGSFRDPDSRIFTTDGRVLRLLSEQGLADWRELSSSDLFAELVREGRLVGTREVDDARPEAEAEGIHGGVAGVLEHDVIPFVSYPYEWSFSMLRDAALLQLDLLRRSIERGMILKDSSPYNVQFRGAEPVFIDVGSFEKLREGEPWAGYRQFCLLFLNPLLLQAWKGVPFQPWLRGSLDGISPQELRDLLSLRDRFRRGAFTHVVMHARLERRYEERDDDLKGELRKAGFKRELILANVKGLERLIRKLSWEPAASAWSAYRLDTTYSGEDADRKAKFVREAVESEVPRLVWDLGCNEGVHARIAAEHAEYVVAMDADALVVDRLYRSLAQEDGRKILPLAVNITDPPPGLGWRGAERRPLPERGRPDLTLCLALIHHVSIAGNVPVAEFLDWLRATTRSAVIEFVAPEDPMARRLLARKRPNDHPDYRADWFERCLHERFDVVRSETLAGGQRTLHLVRPKS
jgi:SAM-dependent methyltransferase